jgi:hypothetical protein
LVLIHFCGGGWVIEVSDLFDQGVIAPILTGEEGKESGSCGLYGGLSIVRMDEEFDDIGGFPRLPPGQ